MSSSPWRTFFMKTSSPAKRSTCCRTFVVTASRSKARVSRKWASLDSSRPVLIACRARDSSVGSLDNCCIGNCAALTAPHNSWPRTTRTFTFKWFTAYCNEAVVPTSKAFPATRTTKMSPRPWSKMISVGTRESEQPRMATQGNCFEINARRSNALASGRVALPVQNRALPRWSSASTSDGVRAAARLCSASAWALASSIEKPSQAMDLIVSLSGSPEIFRTNDDSAVMGRRGGACGHACCCCC
mmetsp:Transcript_88591/g.255544  ORF Transcript_88591/g.255544 Transcript_88591/m.255544 type:complete len:244 (-) Transcript_88591:240-971(-)